MLLGFFGTAIYVPIGYRYRTPSYASGVFDAFFFEKNLQGDVMGQV